MASANLMKEGVCVIKNLIIIAVNVLLLIAFIVCLSVSTSLVTPLRSQQAAEAWAGQSGERFAQLSVFFPESHTFDNNDIRSLHSSIDTALLTVSLESTSDRALYTDAWSGIVEISIFNERGPVSAKAIAVGGDYFLFHPFFLRSGSYLSPNDLMKDRVVLDEELAWRLFGSVHLVGFEIFIEERPFIIAGVISREKDFANSKAYADGAGLYMSFEAAMEITNNEVSIRCYEIVMPDPISGFALNTVTEAINDKNVSILENSERFTLSNSFSAIRSFGERSMRVGTIEYPYWENAARYTEDWLALLLVMSLFFITFPIICGIVYTVKVIRFLIRRGKIAAQKAVEEYDKRQYEKYLAKQGITKQDKPNQGIIKRFIAKRGITNSGNTKQLEATQKIEIDEKQDNYDVDDIIEQKHESDENHDNYNVNEIIREVLGEF